MKYKMKLSTITNDIKYTVKFNITKFYIIFVSDICNIINLNRVLYFRHLYVLFLFQYGLQ